MVRTRRLRAGDVVRYPTEAGLHCEWADLDLELIRLPLAPLTRSPRRRPTRLRGCGSTRCARLRRLMPSDGSP